MSEAAAEAPKKKKSPLPIVIVLVLVLAGGGFFMTKGKGEAKEDKSIIKIAKVETPIEDEFLVNMSDRSTYLRTKIALKFAEGFEAKELEENLSAVEDAIVLTLRDTGPDDIRTHEQMLKLKRRLAEAINKVLEGSGEHGEAEHGKVTQIRRKVEEEELPPGWDSNTGPVLQIFFKTFATQ